MSGTVTEQEYQFTNDWFQSVRSVWDALFPRIKPTRILEIGSFEGASACYMIELCSTFGDLELHCIDPWDWDLEHRVTSEGSGQGLKPKDLERITKEKQSIEQRFDHNISIAISRAKSLVRFEKHKTTSLRGLAKLIHEERFNYFDLIYIDGLHTAPAVLIDSVMAFPLLRVGGCMIFDDYIWHTEDQKEKDPLNNPKIAVDAFLNINARKTKILKFPLIQQYVLKIAE